MAFSQIMGGFGQFWAKLFKKCFERALDNLFFTEKQFFTTPSIFCRKSHFWQKISSIFQKMGILAPNKHILKNIEVGNFILKIFDLLYLNIITSRYLPLETENKRHRA